MSSRVIHLEIAPTEGQNCVAGNHPTEIDLWFSYGDNVAAPNSPGDIFHCLKTFWVVTTEVGDAREASG